MELDKIVCMDALEYMRGLPDASAQLIIADPPYYKVKDSAWDNQWDTPSAFIGWLHTILEAMRRVLAPNGSLYLFACPRMAARVELATAEYFNVLNRITWAKPTYSTKAEMIDKETMRAFFPSSEIVFFCEQRGSDDSAIGEAGYHAVYDEAKRQLKYTILAEYLESEFNRAGVSRREIAALFPSATGNLTGCVSNWLLGYNLPTSEQYHAMREYLNNRNGDEYLRKEYEELRKEYEELRKEYEELRRPFNSSDRLPYTDVWTYRTVNAYPGKHECEKPHEMMQDIVTLSSRPGDIILDPFCGSGASLKAARLLGRRYIGCDSSPHWADYARVNVNSNRQIRYIEDKTLQNGDVQLSLFGD